MEVVGGVYVTSRSLQAQGIEAELPTYGCRHGCWPKSRCLASSMVPFMTSFSLGIQDRGRCQL